MIPIEGLTEFDFEILESCEAAPVDLEELARKLPRQKALKLRVKLLSTPDVEYYEMAFGRKKALQLRDTYYLSLSGGKVRITELGLKALEDYRSRQSKERRQRLIEYVWKFAPIVISLISLAKSYQSELKAIWQMLQ